MTWSGLQHSTLHSAPSVDCHDGVRASPSLSLLCAVTVTQWRSTTSLHDLTALGDQCGLPSLRTGCASYGLLCIPPSLPGGYSTVTQWSNSSYSVSCDACPASSSLTTAYICRSVLLVRADVASVRCRDCLVAASGVCAASSRIVWRQTGVWCAS